MIGQVADFLEGVRSARDLSAVFAALRPLGASLGFEEAVIGRFHVDPASGLPIPGAFAATHPEDVRRYVGMIHDDPFFSEYSVDDRPVLFRYADWEPRARHAGAAASRRGRALPRFGHAHHPADGANAGWRWLVIHPRRNRFDPAGARGASGRADPLARDGGGRAADGGVGSQRPRRGSPDPSRNGNACCGSRGASGSTGSPPGWASRTTPSSSTWQTRAADWRPDQRRGRGAGDRRGADRTVRPPGGGARTGAACPSACGAGTPPHQGCTSPVGQSAPWGPGG